MSCDYSPYFAEVPVSGEAERGISSSPRSGSTMTDQKVIVPACVSSLIIMMPAKHEVADPTVDIFAYCQRATLGDIANDRNRIC